MNNAGWIVVLGFYTLVMIGGIYYYEDKFNRLDKDYKDLEQEFFETYNAYCNMSELASQYNELARKAEDQSGLYENAYNSEHNAIHHQIEINEMLDEQNRALQAQIKALKLENSELRSTAGDWQRAYELSKPIQYESSGWAGLADNTNTTYTIDTNPYKVDINYIQDHLDFEQ